MKKNLKNKSAAVNERRRKENKHRLSIAKNLEKKLINLVTKKKKTSKDIQDIVELKKQTESAYCKTHLHKNKQSRIQKKIAKMPRN